MDKITVTAKTYDEAITKALIGLQTTSDHMVVEETMRSLSELESAALSYFIAGYSPVEISEKLGKSLKTVQNALARAKGKFRNNLPR